MGESTRRKPILTAQALDGLRQAKPQILDAVANRVPERLVLATAMVATAMARHETAPEDVLPSRVLELVRDSLRAMARQKWKPDTALRLQRRSEGGSHGIAQ